MQQPLEQDMPIVTGGGSIQEQIATPDIVSPDLGIPESEFRLSKSRPTQQQPADRLLERAGELQ